MTNSQRLNRFANAVHRADYPLQKGLVVEPFKLVLLRAGGKVGGTSVQKGYLEPLLCQRFFSQNKKEEKLVSTFGGNRLPQGCLETLRKRGIYYQLSRQSNIYFSDMYDYRFAVLMRDPLHRAPSSYYWMMRRRDPKKFPFSSFLQDVHWISRYAGKKLNSNHWATQVSVVMRANMPRFDNVICAHKLVFGFNELLHRLNDTLGRQAKLPAFDIHQNKRNVNINSLVDFDMNSSEYFRKVCMGSIYTSDCKLIPCSAGPVIP